jgi:hypothetical protein
MGYYEQIGKWNRQYAKERTAMHPLRRKLSDAFWNGVIIVATILIWAILLSPLWLWAVR